MSARRKPRSWLLRRFLAHPRGRLALGLLIVLVGLLLIGPLVYTADPYKMNFGQKLLAPSVAHPAGTDQFGRDVLSRIIEGGRMSVAIGGAALAWSFAFGLAIGVASAMAGAWLDALLMRLIDILLAIPHIVICLTLIAVLGVGPGSLMIAVACSFFAILARLARTLTQEATVRADVLAAEMAGLPRWRIAAGHILPGVASEVLVLTVLSFAEVLGIVAGLSFVGLGVQPPTPEWGSMLNEARPFFRPAPWLIYAPLLGVLVCTFAATLTAIVLRDAYDPNWRMPSRNRPAARTAGLQP
jgi:ABC-type dipeptide/oligopeptide/nickel transport system permease subunit